MGSFQRTQNTAELIDKISTAIPQGWNPDSIDSIATANSDWSRIVVKAVNYGDRDTNLFLRLKGAHAPSSATVTVHTIAAKEMDVASMDSPGLYKVQSKIQKYSRDLWVELPRYSVIVVEVAL